jgi:hypothetical protein
VGKSTLMRAIAKGQLEGFPPPDKLKTVYVEHDIQVRCRRWYRVDLNSSVNFTGTHQRALHVCV